MMMKKWSHSMSCRYPEGCNCGASEQSSLIKKITEQRTLMYEAAKALSDWNRGQGTSEDSELIAKLRS